MFLHDIVEGSETFISVILASRVKIGALNYGAVPEILTSLILLMSIPKTYGFVDYQKLMYGFLNLHISIFSHILGVR